jgi:ABC-type transport system substrate-binding protein
MMLAFRRAAVLTIVALAGLGAGGALAQDKPRSGGVLNWFDYGDPGRLDVHAESPLVVQQATAGIWSGLLHYHPDDPSKIAGDLAERWTASPDGRTYTFHLRRGVKWHDGQPFSSADVKATFDRILNPDFKGPKCVVASAWCRVAAKHILEKFGDLDRPEAQIGTGPFRFKRYERGNLIE